MAWLWVGFIAFVVTMLAIDLFFINRKAHVVRAREALSWTGVCIVMALLFSGVVYYIYSRDVMGIGTRYAQSIAAEASRAGSRSGDHAPARSIEPAPVQPAQVRSEQTQPEPVQPASSQKGSSAIESSDPGSIATGTPALMSPDALGRRAFSEFLAGWLIEYSLSLDNIFVIAMIFLHFRVKPQFQHRVLFWGILGALFLRGVMILGGAMLIEKFHWTLYIFAAVLLVTAVKMLRGGAEHYDPEHSPVLRVARRVLRVSAPREDQRFVVREGGRLAVTPLFIVLLMVESTDVIFAVDSIPAIFAVTRDPFLVFTSNVFAILGLRSLYFALSSLMDSFSHLKYSLAFVLAFVGVKMLLGMWGIHLSSGISLGVIVLALGAGVGSSLLFGKRSAGGAHAPGHVGEAVHVPQVPVEAAAAPDDRAPGAAS